MKSDRVPIIKTRNVELIELSPKHSSDVFTFASHEHVTKTVTWAAHQNVDDSVRYIERVRSRISKKENSIFYCWAVKDPVISKIMGMVSITQLDTIRAQIGYVFHYEKWRTQVPLESLRVIIHYAFNNFPTFERIQCRCYPENKISIDLLNKLGFHDEGINYSMIKVRGEVKDLTCFSMTRKRWDISKVRSGRLD